MLSSVASDRRADLLNTRVANRLIGVVRVLALNQQPRVARRRFNHDIRAVIAIEQLKKLPADLERRAEVRRRYVERLAAVGDLVVPFAGNREFVSNYIMPVVLTKGDAEYRDSIRGKMHAAGIQTSVHYPAVHCFSVYRGFPAALPQTEFVTDHEITLPMYAALTGEQVDFIVKTLDDSLHG